MADKTNKKENDNVAINAETDHKSFVEEQAEYVEKGVRTFYWTCFR